MQTNEDVRGILLDTREVARRLCVCEKTVSRLVKDGQIQVVRIGRAVRFTLDDLAAFIASRKGVCHE